MRSMYSTLHYCIIEKTYMVYIIFITTLIIQSGADQDPLVNYKCLGKDVLVVHSKTSDYVRMHCGTPQICGETRVPFVQHTMR